MPSHTLSLSESIGQPLASTVAPFGVSGQVSTPSQTPSPSVSIGQPFASTRHPAGVFGHSSFLSQMPSRSTSSHFDSPPIENCRPPV
jgi:hypothetical protein